MSERPDSVTSHFGLTLGVGPRAAPYRPTCVSVIFQIVARPRHITKTRRVGGEESWT